MKSMLVVGIGRFGIHLIKELVKLGNEVMVINDREDGIEEIIPIVNDVIIGDCTKKDVLNSVGVGNFDVCFVCVGTNFQASLETTFLLKELGAKCVVSRVSEDVQEKFLLRNGADEIVYPERQEAERAAVKYSSESIFDFFELSNNVSIYETALIPQWIGKSLSELNFRARYRANVLAVKDADERR